MRRLLFLTLLLAAFVPPALLLARSETYPPGPATIDIAASKIRWNPQDWTDTDNGSLRFLAGFELTSPDGRFGGLSGLAISPDGATLSAVTDTGHWITMPLTHDGNQLKSPTSARLTPLQSHQGAPLSGKRDTDAEGLTIDPQSGATYISFERHHRITRLTENDRVEIVVAQEALGALTNNKGLEALTFFKAPGSDQTQLLALSEGSLDEDGNFKGFLRTLEPGAPLSAVSVKARAPFNPTDVTQLPDGDLLLLERRYSPAGGVGVQIRKIPGADAKANALLDGPVILQASNRYSIDNMEGIATRTANDGKQLVYLMSDDNFNPLQRTLLLQFEMTGAP